MKKALSYIFKLRIEEFISMIFMIPSLAVTIYAFTYYQQTRGSVPRYISGGLWRLAVVVLMFGLIYLASKYADRSKFAFFMRENLPYFLSIAVYTNLHDTVAFINPGDISPALIKADAFLFGQSPVLWAEQFYTPFLTEMFSLFYMNFFVYSLVLLGVMWFTNKYEEYRMSALGLVLLFYGGYIFYIMFPAIPPRLTLLPEFTRTLDGNFITNFQNKVVNVSFATSRAAFPSLHCANTMIIALFAWKYKRWLFWVFLPFGTGLVLATVYLRHHYVVDIFAGFALAALMFWLTPIMERAWQRGRAKYANAPAEYPDVKPMLLPEPVGTK